MQEINTIFYIVILIMSVVIHEISHGYAALHFGDKTALHAGRLTLNPLKHLDLYGSIIIPLILIVTHSPFLIGWAKPVPYNPANLRDVKKGTIWVASAGIIANIVIAVTFSIVIRLGVHFGLPEGVISISEVIVMLNILLAIFNLIPIPPLDGSKILFALIPNKMRYIEGFLQKYSLIFLLVFIFFLWRLVSPIIFWLFKILTGIS